jgi:hypothetical protein
MFASLTGLLVMLYYMKIMKNGPTGVPGIDGPPLPVRMNRLLWEIKNNIEYAIETGMNLSIKLW